MPIQNTQLARYTLILVFGFLLFGALYFARDFLIPVAYAGFLSMLMLPVSKKTESWGVNRGFSSIISILVILSIILFLIFLLSTQVFSFAEDLPAFKDQLKEKLTGLQEFIERKTNVSSEKQISYLKERSSMFFENAGRYLQDIFITATGSIASLALIVIYMFFFLFYRNSFNRFILRITPSDKHRRARKMLEQASKVTQKYLTGILIVIFILAILNSIGLLILDIPHAIFFGVLAALLNVIPYIGIWIGGAFPFIVALLIFDSVFPAFAVAGVFAFIQFIENNFLTPNIVGSQVKIKPLFTIMALIIGGGLWGISGMILFIPLLGAVKVVLDNVPALQPYGELIGEEIQTKKESKFVKKVKKVFSSGSTGDEKKDNEGKSD